MLNTSMFDAVEISVAVSMLTTKPLASLYLKGGYFDN